jgi:hypothetical protein
MEGIPTHENVHLYNSDSEKKGENVVKRLVDNKREGNNYVHTVGCCLACLPAVAATATATSSSSNDNCGVDCVVTCCCWTLLSFTAQAGACLYIGTAQAEASLY